MDTIVLGMVISVKGMYDKEKLPKAVTLLGMMVVLQPLIRVLVAVSMMALQLYLLSYTVFPVSTTMVSSNTLLEKAYSRICVTDCGMYTEVMSESQANAERPINVIVLGMDTPVIWHINKAPASILVTV